MTPPITYFVAGVPAPQGSKRHVGHGRLIESSKKVAPWRAAVTAATLSHVPDTLTGPITLEVVFVMPRPKAWGKNRQDPMVQQPDLDKLIRAVDDALTGHAFADDSQVTHITAMKRRARRDEPTGVWITLKETP